MGVDLGNLVPRQRARLQDFSGRVLAVDGFNTLYQFLSIIRQPDGTPLMDAQGNVTSHLAGLLYRTANLIEAGIRPAFVFDGPPHPLKRATLDTRARRKVVAEAAHREAVAAGDVARARTAATQTSRLTGPMIVQAKALLDGLGLPWVDAPGEGEAEASRLAQDGTAFGAVSQDFDSLLFGAPRLVRNLAVTGRRKLPGKRVFVDVEPEVIELDATLKALHITREQLVEAAILIGTDFNAGIHGVGPKRAVKLIQDHQGLKGALGHLGADIPNASEILDIFLRPQVAPATLSWKAPNRESVLHLLVDVHAFTRERVETALDRYSLLAETARQRSLDAFFG
ncbi:MAG: flap endonuclease-1 [Thermoplasmatota archaeon]